MIRFSAPYSPSTMTRGDVFNARQYPRQAFGNLIDPVLNIDWFEMKGPTFPAHPHAGFSAVTYLFPDSPNGFHNRDSLGEEHVILPGGLHWSRASKGMIHEETPLPGGGTVRGLQIFLNLPEARQSDDAGAYPVLPESVQSAVGEGWESRTAVDGTAIGPAREALPAPMRIAEVAIEQGAIFPLDLPAGWGGIVIALEGEVALGDDRTLDAAQSIGFAAEAAASLHITAIAGAARIAIVMGQQLNQPIHSYGPLMLASPEALERARAYVGTLSIPQLHPAD
jgi:hypothetical protein